MSANQITKLEYKLILLNNTVLNLVIKYKKKTHTYYATRRAENKGGKKLLTKYSRLTFRMSISAFLLSLCQRLISQ